MDKSASCWGLLDTPINGNLALLVYRTLQTEGHLPYMIETDDGLYVVCCDAIDSIVARTLH